MPTSTPSRTAAATRAAARARDLRAAADPDRLARAARIVGAAATLDDWAVRLAAAAPPLSAEQRTRLAALFTTEAVTRSGAARAAGAARAGYWPERVE